MLAMMPMRRTYTTAINWLADKFSVTALVGRIFNRGPTVAASRHAIAYNQLPNRLPRWICFSFYCSFTILTIIYCEAMACWAGWCADCVECVAALGNNHRAHSRTSCIYDQRHQYFVCLKCERIDTIGITVVVISFRCVQKKPFFSFRLL